MARRNATAPKGNNVADTTAADVHRTTAVDTSADVSLGALDTDRTSTLFDLADHSDTPAKGSQTAIRWASRNKEDNAKPMLTRIDRDDSYSPQTPSKPEPTRKEEPAAKGWWAELKNHSNYLPNFDWSRVFLEGYQHRENGLHLGFDK